MVTISHQPKKTISLRANKAQAATLFWYFSVLQRHCPAIGINQMVFMKTFVYSHILIITLSPLKSWYGEAGKSHTR